MSNGADVAGPHGHDDIAIANDVLERARQILHSLDEQRLDLSAAAHSAAQCASIRSGNRRFASET